MATKKTSSPIKKVTKGKGPKGGWFLFMKGMNQQAKANDQKMTRAEISAKWKELDEGATYVFGGAWVVTLIIVGLVTEYYTGGAPNHALCMSGHS